MSRELTHDNTRRIKNFDKKVYNKLIEFVAKHRQECGNKKFIIARKFLQENRDIKLSEQTVARHYVADILQKYTAEVSLPNTTDETIERKESNDTQEINYKGQKQITSLEEAISFFEIDLKEWEVSDWSCKSWDTSMKIDELIEGKIVTKPIKKTNYLVSVKLKKRKEVDYTAIFQYADNWIIPKNIDKTKGEEVGVLTISDLHAGLYINPGENGIVKMPTYNLQKLTQFLTEISHIVNSQRYKKLYLFCLGDLVESVTGYNKIETLKELERGEWGGNIIIKTYEIILKFISSLNNLQEVYIVSGNHDRFTPDKAMDKDGGAAQIIAYFLNKTVPTKWHPIVLNPVIDNISYILFHGHLKLGDRDLGKIVLEYGKQNLYNVILQGHLHHRRSTKLLRENNMIQIDTTKYRAITVPAITTGNRWAEEMGYGAPPGFTITKANTSKTNIHHFDFSL